MSRPNPSSPAQPSTLIGVLFLGASLLTCPLVLSFLLSPSLLEKLNGLLWVTCMGSLGLAAFAFLGKTPPAKWWKQSGPVNAWLFLFSLTLVLCSNRIYAMQFIAPRILLYLLVLVQMFRAYRIWVVKPQSKGWRMRITTSLLPLFTLFILAEIAFLFVIRSHGSYPDSYAHIGWMHRHWDLNPDGYRDASFERAAGKPAVLVLGDSFTAGSGLKDPEERFSNLLEAQMHAALSHLTRDPTLEALPSPAYFFNLGQPGANTPQVLEVLKSQPDRPGSTLLLVYCLNDIHDAAEKAGVEFSWIPPGAGLPRWLLPLMHYSHSLNYAFSLYAHGYSEVNYVDWLWDCFQREEVMALHRQELDQVLNEARRRQMPVRALVFPLMQAPQESASLTHKVTDYFRSRGVPVLDLGAVLKESNPEEIWVSSQDPHPNAKTHALAAKLLFPGFAINSSPY